MFFRALLKNLLCRPQKAVKIPYRFDKSVKACFTFSFEKFFANFQFVILTDLTDNSPIMSAF